MALAVAIIVSASLAFAGTFSEWQAGKFSAEELGSAAISGPNADPDEDSRANLLEYAFGLDPFLPDTDESALSIGSESLTFTHREAIGADNLVYRLESSSDLQQWGWITPSPAHREVLSENEEFPMSPSSSAGAFGIGRTNPASISSPGTPENLASPKTRKQSKVP